MHGHSVLRISAAPLVVQKDNLLGVPIRVVFHALAAHPVNLPQFFANRTRTAFAWQVIVVVLLLTQSPKVNEEELFARSFILVVHHRVSFSVIVGAISSHIDTSVVVVLYLFEAPGRFFLSKYKLFGLIVRRLSYLRVPHSSTDDMVQGLPFFDFEMDTHYSTN